MWTRHAALAPALKIGRLAVPCTALVALPCLMELVSLTLSLTKKQVYMSYVQVGRMGREPPSCFWHLNVLLLGEEREPPSCLLAVQATQGGGGWPMSCFLTPSLEPFFGGEGADFGGAGAAARQEGWGLHSQQHCLEPHCCMPLSLSKFCPPLCPPCPLAGTYFPPTDGFGRPGFKTVLRRIAQVRRGVRRRPFEGRCCAAADSGMLFFRLAGQPLTCSAALGPAALLS